MPTIPPLPQLDPASFRWHQSPRDPHTVQRLANGTEAWVGIQSENAKGQYDNYLNTTLRVIGNTSSSSTPSLASLRENLAAALIHVRFQHPEVACTAVWDGSGPGPPHIQYTPPRDNAEALTWARDTIEMRITPQTGLELRTELEEQRQRTVPKSAKSMVMFLIADVVDEETPLTPGTVVDMLMHFNHIYWDAVSSRLFVGDLLRRLGARWGGDEHQRLPEYKWGKEVANPSEPILDACKIDVGTLGDEFNEAREEFIASLMSSGVCLLHYVLLHSFHRCWC